MRQRTSLLGQWSLTGLAAANLIVAVVWVIFRGGFLIGTLLGALAVLQYLAAFMLRVEVRSPVVPIAMVATALSGFFLWGTSVWLGIGSLCCIAVATWAWMQLPRKLGG